MNGSIPTSSIWLDYEDAQCREDRLSRLDWLVSHTPRGEFWTFPGGVVAKSQFEEMRYCFVYGQFLASTILAVSYIEVTLAALFFEAGRDDLVEASVSKLIEEAHKKGLITDLERKRLHAIRETRNAYVHLRKPGHRESVERRAIRSDSTFNETMEEDARIVLQAALRMVAKNSI